MNNIKMSIILIFVKIYVYLLEKEKKGLDLKYNGDDGWEDLFSGKELGYDFIGCKRYLEKKLFNERETLSSKNIKKSVKLLEKIEKNLNSILKK